MTHEYVHVRMTMPTCVSTGEHAGVLQRGVPGSAGQGPARRQEALGPLPGDFTCSRFKQRIAHG